MKTSVEIKITLPGEPEERKQKKRKAKQRTWSSEKGKGKKASHLPSRYLIYDLMKLSETLVIYSVREEEEVARRHNNEFALRRRLYLFINSMFIAGCTPKTPGRVKVHLKSN
jgi:hypothetical protein